MAAIRRTRTRATPASPEEIDQARRRRREHLAAAVSSLQSEEGFRAWLRATKAFHRYSRLNCLLIASQCPEATYVASYRRWLHDLGYQVRKGERGLMIFRPITLARGEGSDVPEEDEPGRVLFRATHVFDRAQVEPIPGRALPLEPPDCAPVEGDSHAVLVPALEALAGELGYRVERQLMPASRGGFCDAERRLIALRAGQSPNGEVRVLAHECAHAMGVGYATHGRERAECIVECATYMALAAAGLDVSASSVPYIAGWGSDDAEAIERDAAEIDRIARRLEAALRPSQEVTAEAA